MANLVQRCGRWHVCAMVDGALVRRSLHTSDLSEARIRRDEILLPLRSFRDERLLLTSVKRQLEGISAEEERRKAEENKGPMLSAAWDMFLKDPERRACKEQQLKDHMSNWNRFMGWMKKQHPEVMYCRDVTKGICAEWAGDMLESVRATNTYNHYISSVRYVFTSVCNMHDELRNPMERLHKKKDDDCISKEMFTEEDLRAIFGSLDREFRRLCGIGLYTTLRLGSARMLTWDMVSDDLTYLSAVHDKTGADASQRIAPELAEILGEVEPNDRTGFICPSFAAMEKAKAAHVVQEKLEALGIQTRREVMGLNGKIRRACVKGFHSFRHTAITLALRNGATVSQTKRLAGHASERMQERYTHLGADDAGKAAAAIGKFW